MSYTTEQIEYVKTTMILTGEPVIKGDSQEVGFMLEQLLQQRAELLEALKDMRNGWRYIRDSHGDLYGVGWDRAEDKANAAIAKAESSQAPEQDQPETDHTDLDAAFDAGLVQARI